MLQILNYGRAVPIQRTVDPNAEFTAGMIGQLKFLGADIVLGVSDGIAPFGIIDDTKEVAYMKPVIDELVMVVPDPILVDYTTDPFRPRLKLAIEGKLQHANISQSTFASDVAGVDLAATNGLVVFPIGMELNHQSSPLGTVNDSVAVKVRYSFYVPNMPGVDTTAGSTKVTVWANPAGFIGMTDQYETNVPYPLNAALYCSSKGRFTTERSMSNQPSIAMVTVPPTAANTMIEFVWL